MTRVHAIRLRRGIGITCIVLLLGVDAFATGLFGGNERILAIARSIVLPGLPFLEWHAGIGLATMAAALASVAAWLRWGIDWLPVLVMVVGTAVAAWVMPLHHVEAVTPAGAGSHHHAAHETPPRMQQDQVVRASHEFTVVLVIFALLARVRLLVTRIPAVSRLIVRCFPAAGRHCRDIWLIAAISALSGRMPPSTGLSADPRLRARTKRIERWARLRSPVMPPAAGHAGIRGAMALCGELDPNQLHALKDESTRSLAGVPASEPTWVRPLDGMLVALGLSAAGHADAACGWQNTLHTSFRLRHGRRPAALHLPSMLAIGTMPDWEHALTTALAHERGWIDDQDWQHLRPRCLGRAARGATDPESLRLIASGLRWAHHLRDREAIEILSRRTLDTDPLALVIAAMPLPAPLLTRSTG